MKNRRNYTNQFGAFVPTETEAMKNMSEKPRQEKEPEIVVRRHPTILREEDIKEMDKKRRKPFSEWIKEELNKEEDMSIYEDEAKRQEIYDEERKKKQREYYQAHKERFAENQRNFRKNNKEKIKEYQHRYYANKTKKKRAEEKELHSYVDVDGIRIVKEDKKIVGWYRPDGWEQNDEK